MISRYRLLAERLRAELTTLEQVIERAEDALRRAAQQAQDQDYFLDLHGFYVGLERLFGLIAVEVDETRPAGPRWHRDLLAQMWLMCVRQSSLPKPVLPSQTTWSFDTWCAMSTPLTCVKTG